MACPLIEYYPIWVVVVAGPLTGNARKSTATRAAIGASTIIDIAEGTRTPISAK